jgi:hypothetical protein
MRNKSLLLYLCLLAISFSVVASDIEREKRMADEIVDSIIDGEPVYLKRGEQDFLTIYAGADEPLGAVIIMHGRGFHANWSDVAYPLRLGLSEQDWNTLSLQMPVLDVYGGAEYPAVIKGAPVRLAAIQQAGHPKSQQITVPGANHCFADAGDALLEAVGAWLQDL